MDKNKTPADIAQEHRDAETVGDDPAKEHRLTLNGEPLVQDEYFFFDLENFRKPQEELEKILKEINGK